MSAFSRRSLLAGSAAVAAAGAIGVPASAEPTPGSPIDHRRIHRWTADTWASLVAMTDETTGLTADNIGKSVRNPERSGYTSPTNIGGYLWSTIVVRDLGLISRGEANRRLSQTLRTLGRLDRHSPSGMFFNWYDERTGAVLHTWPPDGSPVYPFLSSVDNGWLAAALIVVSNAAGDVKVARLAEQLLEPMNFKIYYDPNPPGKPPGGLLRGGFWPEKPPTPPDTVEGNYLGVGPNVFYTGFWYDTAVSETRIASYIGIARGQLPPVHYFAKWRTFPASCDWSWQEQQPVGTTRTYLGVDVFEGAYTYRGLRVVPGWGGSMFEALMPDVFVPEAQWAPRSWGLNHPLTVRAHREHGLDDANYGYWGFSPSSDPAVVNGYREFGVDAIGLNPDGYFSDEEKTNYDAGFGTCRPATAPNPTYVDGVVTPHASFLAMQHEARQAYDNLVKIEEELGAYGDGGFFDAVAVRSRKISERYLSLDQAMILGAIGNVFGGDIVRQAFCAGTIRRRIRPLIAMEQFSAGIVG